MASSRQAKEGPRARGQVSCKRLQCGAGTIEAFPVLEGRSEEEGSTLYRDETGSRFFLEKSAGVEELTPENALSWAMEQCFRGWHLENFVRRACSGTFWTQQQGGRGLGKQLGCALARNLRNVAARENRTPYEQLRVFIVRGLAECEPKKRNGQWARKRGVATDRAMQLELATTLVEVVRKLETAPSEPLLANAQLAASELNRRLSQEAPLMAANG